MAAGDVTKGFPVCQQTKLPPPRASPVSLIRKSAAYSAGWPFSGTARWHIDKGTFLRLPLGLGLGATASTPARYVGICGAHPGLQAASKQIRRSLSEARRSGTTTADARATRGAVPTAAAVSHVPTTQRSPAATVARRRAPRALALARRTKRRTGDAPEGG